MNTITEVKAILKANGFEHVVIEESRTQEWGSDCDTIVDRQEFIKVNGVRDLSCTLTASLGFNVEGNNVTSSAARLIDSEKCLEAVRKAVESTNITVSSVEDNEIVEID